MQITLARDDEDAARQWDGKGRYIDCHSIPINGHGLTRAKFLRNLHKIKTPILGRALWPHYLVHKEQDRDHNDDLHQKCDDNDNRQPREAFTKVRY
jgi:hypothetical protein